MSAEVRFKFAAKAMGTAVSVHIADVVPQETADDAWESVGVFLHDIEDRFSTFLQTSEISRINNGELHMLDASPDVVEVLDACTWLEHLSNGVFNARRPDGSIDPAGFVKGWAAERAASLLAEAGLRSLKEFGRLVVVGFATGTIPSLPANQVLLRNRTVVGVDWGAWAMGHGAENAVVMAEVMALAAEGKIKPVEPSSRPLDEAPAVLRELLERQVVGKVCLVP